MKIVSSLCEVKRHAYLFFTSVVRRFDLTFKKMSPKTPFIALILLLSISLNEGLRILLFFPIASKSHSLLGHGVARNLLDAGHEVVHINAYPSENPNPNLKEINVGMVVEEMKRKMEKDAKEKDEDFKLQNLVGKHRNMADSLLLVFLAYELHKQLFTFKPVVDLLSDPEEHFDAVIVEWFFSDVPAGMAPLFKCPLIWMWSSEPYWQLLQLIDEIPNPAFTVDLFSDYQPPLTLCQRMAQVFKLAKNYLIRNIILGLFNRMQYNSVFSPVAAKRGITMPSYSDAIYNGSMLLLNSHPSIGTPYRLPQNAKYIGGYHIDRNVKPLPKDLQKLMDEAKDGVIYFSMGSNLRSADLSDEMKEALFEMFGKLKQTVLWKFETDIKKVPPNVHLLKWAPQPSILSHPNLKIFITHGGQLSTTEAVHFGVPVIGIPVYGDQYINMKSVSKKGFGITLELTDDLVENLFPAINEILVNSRTPGEELVYWIEYTVATDGAPHLRSPALHVPFYQKMHLDIIAILTIAVTLLFKTVRRLYRMFKGKELDKKKKTE